MPPALRASHSQVSIGCVNVTTVYYTLKRITYLWDAKHGEKKSKKIKFKIQNEETLAGAETQIIKSNRKNKLPPTFPLPPPLVPPQCCLSHPLGIAQCSLSARLVIAYLSLSLPTFLNP